MVSVQEAFRLELYERNQATFTTFCYVYPETQLFRYAYDRGKMRAVVLYTVFLDRARGQTCWNERLPHLHPKQVYRPVNTPRQ